MLRNKTPAPDFSLPDENGTCHDLTQLREGKLLTILFFRGAFCPTAQRDLMGYANTYSRLQAMNGDLVAISVDEPETLKQLKEKLQLPFRLLADADFSVARAYGVYESDETDEGPQPHAEPAVFLLDADGKIAYSQIQTGPKGHASTAELALIVFYMQQNDGRYWGDAMELKIKRVYEPPGESDGTRILIDRLWPRGLSKEKAAVDLWLKEIAPSTELRKWFDHDPDKWDEFQKRYRDELEENEEGVQRLRDEMKRGAVTLVYGAKDEEHNDAVALRNFFELN